MSDLSVLIPARNEEFLNLTIANILDNIRGNTDIIVVLDGYTEKVINDHRVDVVKLPTSIGQRAATNMAARLSSAKFIMKLDAHCAVDQGFDIKLMSTCEPSWVVIPRMYNLHGFDWECKKCGNRTYQGPKPGSCEKCDNTVEFEKVIVWQPRLSRKTDYARFDNQLIFQYWGSYGKREEVKAQGDISDVMSSVGACWFMHRERFWELGGCDEAHGSWGQFGTEWACKSWLSGGRQVVNKYTWFSHMFRTQPGFGFPYPLSGNAVDRARNYSRWLWNLEKPKEMPNWAGAIRPLSWILDKFYPIPDWHNDN